MISRPSVWEQVLPKLLSLIQEKHKKDRKDEFKRQLGQRHAEFKPLYDDFLQNTLTATDRVFAPNSTDACILPSVQTLLSASDATIEVTRERLASIQQRLVIDIRNFGFQTKCDLLEMLYHLHNGPLLHQPPYDIVQIDAELAKASSLFTCHLCPLRIALAAPEICAHWRDMHPEHKWNDGWPCVEFRNNHEWMGLSPPWISALRSGPSNTRAALATLGLPQDTSMAELDHLVREGRLICVCAHPMLTSLRPYGWGALASVPEPLRPIFISHISFRYPMLSRRSTGTPTCCAASGMS